MVVWSAYVWLPSHARTGFRRPYTPRPVRSRVIRTAAWGVVAVGVLAPLVRKRLSTPPLVAQTIAFAAPVGLCVAVPRTRTRDVAVCCLQMWACTSAAPQDPHDDGPRIRARARHLSDRGRSRARPRRVADGAPATQARARAVAPGRPRARVGPLAVVPRAPRHARLHHAAPPGPLPRAPRCSPTPSSSIGAMVYWIVPTAPPWYAASRGSRGDFNGRRLATPSSRAGAGATPIAYPNGYAGDVAVRRADG